MKQKIRYLDKTKKCNKRCSSCKYWDVGRITAFGITKTTYNFCNNEHSDEYLKHNHYWNCCKCFTWADNIIDKQDISNKPIKLKNKRELFKEHGRKYPCITCRKFLITKECDRKNMDDCFDCEYFKCENCTQFGNLDCDGDIVV